MCEDINIENFENKFPEIKKSLEDARFISVDLEFSALYPLKDYTPSLFDTPEERYHKIRKNTEVVMPVQIGLTAFICDPVNNRFLGKIYNFYLLPPTFPTLRKNFVFQSTAIKFLAHHGFDFNQFASLGLPFMSRLQEENLRKKLRNGCIREKMSEFKSELKSAFLDEKDRVLSWYSGAKEGDKLSLPGIYEKYWNNCEIMYFIQKRFRREYKNVLTSVENEEFVLVKLSEKDYAELKESQNLEEELITKLLGFTRVFRLLTSLQKPLVGHNPILDIFLMVNSFECPLPYFYGWFKKLVIKLFPVVFDTKHISRQIKFRVPPMKRWRDTDLETLYKFFSSDMGKFLAYGTPNIELLNKGYAENYHEAGWDSYCAGYIFLRMAFWNLDRNFKGLRSFTGQYLISAFEEEFKNKINVARCSVHYIKLDGDDPRSLRPYLRVLQSTKKYNYSVGQISKLLNTFGFVEVRDFPLHMGRYLIAADNQKTANIIDYQFIHDKDFKIMEYDWWEHSAGANVVRFGGFAIGSLLLAVTADAILNRIRG